MTERKPPGVRFETWVEKQIREAAEEGAFEGLSTNGKPLADLDAPRDEEWWVRQKLKREGYAHLPPTLRLRKEAELARLEARHAPTEDEARRIITEINQRIVAAIRLPPSGPPLNLVPFDLERELTAWRGAHGQDEPPPDH